QLIHCRSVTDGTVFEFEPVENDVADQEEEAASRAEKDYFDSSRFMQDLRLNYLVGEEGEGDHTDDMSMPFERMGKSMEPLTNDRGVLKKANAALQVLRPGVGAVVPSDSCVTFHYSAYLEMSDEPFDSTRMRNRPHRSLLSDVLIVGLAKALMTMRKGEVARVLVQPEYAFGKMGCAPRIPGNACILYEVELLHFVDAQDALELEGLCLDGESLPFPKLLELCGAKHKTGNSFCERKEFQRALKCYSSALHRLENARTKDKNEEMQQQQLLLKLFCNASLCCLRTGRANMAVAYGKKALLIEPNNVKALYRCGVGLKMQGYFDEAENKLRRALRCDPNSQAIIHELNELNNIRQQLREAETKMCRRMFSYANNDSSAAAAEAKAAVANTSITEEMRTFIKEKLNALKSSTVGSSLPFTTGFDAAHYDYVRSVCQELGLGCEDLPKGGVRAFVRDAE
ncbi:unnamed protein product, partial [Ixodes hexagonus]